MSKIVCDICGTTYPDTATQCPICGYVRPADAATVMSDAIDSESVESSTYTYVKGGRFSKANVRKRNQAAPGYAPAEPVEIEEEEPAEQKKKGQAGLVITAIVLVLAIIAVLVYIAGKFFLPEGLKPLTNPNSTAASTENTDQTPPPEVPCTDLDLASNAYITLSDVGEKFLISVTALPADTTDTILFASSDEDVATVNADGAVVAVGPGDATITITCGSVVERCYVTCDVETEPPTGPSSEPTGESTHPVDPNAVLKLNRSDITLSKQGETWLLYNGDIDVADITWTTDDPSVATIEKGRVTGVGHGTTKVYGEYNGQKESCIIRCSFPETSQGIPGNGGVTEDGPAPGTYTINKTDVTIKVGESFLLQLRDSNQRLVEVTWMEEDGDYCTIAGNNITGKAATPTGNPAVIYTEYEGHRYSCIVRIYDPEPTE